MTVKTGVDVFLESPKTYMDESNVGLVTNPTGVTKYLKPTLDALHQHPEINLEKVFGPEHGARGEVQDALPIDFYIDEAADIPVYSLYGDNKKPTPEMLDGLESLIFDIQDVGARFYTYASTLRYCLEACKEEGLKLVLLDRPNPINGLAIEGNILQPDFTSFVGMHAIPIRHALTLGELAILSNSDIQADLEVVKMDGWRRDMWFDETGLPWVQPSPNIPTLDTATVYPGTCLAEGVNISEGRGTTRPFEYLGSPWMDGRKWAKTLNNVKTPGVKFRPCYFKPVFGKFENQLCEGVQLHILDRNKFAPVETGLYLLNTALGLWPDKFSWLKTHTGDGYRFDLLAGTDEIRIELSNHLPVKDITGGWEEELDAYRDNCSEFLLY